uniref:Uncharacterized protein n=1 Tax=Oryza meridionalis TaxID=40149 RepID=A0A0E0F726_9ORYZ
MGCLGGLRRALVALVRARALPPPSAHGSSPVGELTTAVGGAISWLVAQRTRSCLADKANTGGGGLRRSVAEFPAAEAVSSPATQVGRCRSLGWWHAWTCVRRWVLVARRDSSWCGRNGVVPGGEGVSPRRSALARTHPRSPAGSWPGELPAAEAASRQKQRRRRGGFGGVLGGGRRWKREFLVEEESGIEGVLGEKVVEGEDDFDGEFLVATRGRDLGEFLAGRWRKAIVFSGAV